MKNKIILLSVIVLSALFFVVSCKKEKLQNSNAISKSDFTFKVVSSIDFSNISIKEKGFEGTNGSIKILAFKDMSSFKATLSELERQTREYDSSFVASYNNLDEEALNDKEEEIGFNDEQPLLDFEEHFGFYSLRRQVLEAEEQWLNHEVLDENSDPTTKYDYLFDEEMALLNRDAEVIIGESIYKLVDNGYYEILDGDINTLSILDNISPENVLPDNVLYNDGNSDCSSCRSGGCRSNKRKSRNKTIDKYRIKWVLSHWTHPWGRRVMAKTKNYKKRGWRWKKYTAYCKARVYGSISDSTNNGDCSKKLVFNTSNGYYAEAVAKKVKHPILVQTKTKSGWVKGYFYGANGISTTQTLIW